MILAWRPAGLETADNAEQPLMPSPFRGSMLRRSGRMDLVSATARRGKSLAAGFAESPAGRPFPSDPPFYPFAPAAIRETG